MRKRWKPQKRLLCTIIILKTRSASLRLLQGFPDLDVLKFDSSPSPALRISLKNALKTEIDHVVLHYLWRAVTTVLLPSFGLGSNTASYCYCRVPTCVTHGFSMSGDELQQALLPGHNSASPPSQSWARYSWFLRRGICGICS